MRIKKLNYQNFRGIIDLNLNLPDSQTIVLAGANGSAKTTILDGAAILLSRLVTRIVSSRRTGRLFSEKDIYNNKNETSNSISILWGETQVSWKISKARQRSSKQKTSDFGEAKKIAERVREQLYRNKDISVPVAVYYPVNRAVLDIPLRIRKNHEFHQETAYEQALGGASSDFRIFFEWFR
ncbi:MAG: AAA family ATPase, partial [Gammaproteobacteria bacterium]|nr:AAA family ATPase [Gammaproteobacteria bacterium]